MSIREKWYSKGLRFSCKQCGYCCTGTPGGYVWLGEGEAEKIARYLDISREELRKKYLKMEGGQLSLIILPSGACTFYRDGCTIYPARPFQCSSFPFWPHVVQSRCGWDARGQNCPGMDQGDLVSFEGITRILLKYRKIYNY